MPGWNSIFNLYTHMKKIILAIIAICLILSCGEAETALLQLIWSGSLLLIMVCCVAVLNHLEKKEETK